MPGRILRGLLAAVLLAGTSLTAWDAEARTSSSARSSSSGYSKSSSGSSTGSYGYSKPSTGSTASGGSGSGSTGTSGATAKPLWGSSSGSASGTAANTNSTTASGGYSKPGSPAVPLAVGAGAAAASSSAAPAKPTRNVWNRKGGYSLDQAVSASASKSSFDTFKQQQARFQKPAPAVDLARYRDQPLLRDVKPASSYGSYYGQRDGYYGSHGWSAPPYVYQSAPSFGMWDAMFLWYMLDHIKDSGTAATAYHHANDPGYQQWRAEADRLAKDNADMKAKLAELDAKTKQMEGQPRNPAYLPPGVEPGIAVAPQLAVASQSVLRLATGRPDGAYAALGGEMKKLGGGNLNFAVVNSRGSDENLALLAEGKVDAAIVQADALADYQRKNPQAKLAGMQSAVFTEYVHALTKKDSEIATIADLIKSPNAVVVIGPEGSGSARVWRTLKEANPDLAKVKTLEADPDQALTIVGQKPNAVAFMVYKPNAPIIAAADQKGDLRLMDLSTTLPKSNVDANGNEIYRVQKIKEGTYKHLQEARSLKWLRGDQAIKTIAVDAVLVLSKDWVENGGADSVDNLGGLIALTAPGPEKT